MLFFPEPGGGIVKNFCAALLILSALNCDLSAFEDVNGENEFLKQAENVASALSAGTTREASPAPEAGLEGEELEIEMKPPEEVPSRYTLVFDEVLSRFTCKNARGDYGLNVIEEEELLSTKQGECSDLSNWNLTGADLSGANLAGALLGRANLSSADLSGADLHGALMPEALFSSARLVKANLTGAYITKARFQSADLTDANLSGGVNLRESDFTGAVLLRADLSDARAQKINLTSADLREAKLPGAWLYEAVLAGADMRTDLSLAELEGSTYDKDTKFLPDFNRFSEIVLIK